MIKLKCSTSPKYNEPEDLISLLNQNKVADCDATSCRVLLNYLLSKNGKIIDIDVTQAAVTFLINIQPHMYAITLGELKSGARRVN